MAISSFGTLLKIGDGGTPTENFTTIFEVLDIKPPPIERDTEDATNHSSPGGWEEWIPTIKKGGEVTFDINWDPAHATHSFTTGLLKDLDDGTKRNFQVVFPDTGNTTWSFPAYVTKFEPDAPVKGKLTASVTLKISGQPTLA